MLISTNQDFTTSVKKVSSLVAQTLKNLPAVQEIWVRALGQEDPLEKGTATTLEEPGGLQSTGWQTVGPNWATNTTNTTAITSLAGIKKSQIPARPN